MKSSNTNGDDGECCASCGKGGDNLKTCTACKMVKYCNVKCQKAHRSTHKKECKRRAAALHDEALFKQPTIDECPICCLPIPCGVVHTIYQSCCGQTICHGCSYANFKERTQDNYIRSSQNRPQLEVCCPFCRKERPKNDTEWLKRIQRRVELNDPDAITSLGWVHHNGTHGITQNKERGFQFWLQAARLGSIEAQNNVALAYFEGRGVERDEKKALQYWELAAMRGDAVSRHNLGTRESRENGNLERAMKHFRIAVATGSDDSLDTIKQLFMMRALPKAEYEKALRAHKNAIDETKSDQRDEAAKANGGGLYRLPVSYH